MGTLAPLALALSTLVALPSLAHAQGCAPGRVVTDATEGHCCWPGQTWLDAEQRCDGVPACPDGYGGDGATCVSLTAPAPTLMTDDDFEQFADATVVAPPVSAALALGDPLATPPPSLAVPPLRRPVNHNVIGGAIALFLTTYGVSVVGGIIAGNIGSFASCPAPPWFLPLGSFVGLGCNVGFATIGVAVGLGQAVSIFLMVAGGTIFRRHASAAPVALTADGIRISF